MKRLFLSLMVIVSLSIFFISCIDEKKTTINDLEALTESLSSESADYTQEDWDIAENQYDLICEQLDQYDFTDAELKKIGRLKGKCTAILAKKTASDVVKSIHRMGKEAEGFIDGFADGLNQ